MLFAVTVVLSPVTSTFPMIVRKTADFGPSSDLNCNVSTLASKIIDILSPDLKVKSTKLGFKEKTFLSLDSSLAHQTLGWSAKLDIDEAVALTCDWYKSYLIGENMANATQSQILGYAKHNLRININQNYTE